MNEIALAAQRASLGIVVVVEFDAKGLDGSTLTVFTINPDATDEGEFVLLSPNHPDVDSLGSGPEVAEQLEGAGSGGGRREERREADRLPARPRPPRSTPRTA
jgi:hypothetical protein